MIAFFRDVRRRNRPKKYKALAFVPPLGQFQNGTPGRGWLFAGLELATAGTSLTTFLMYRSRMNEMDLCTGTPDFDPKPCERLKTINIITGAAFLAVYAAGVVDGLMGYDDGDPERAAPVAGGVPDRRGDAAAVLIQAARGRYAATVTEAVTGVGAGSAAMRSRRAAGSAWKALGPISTRRSSSAGGSARANSQPT